MGVNVMVSSESDGTKRNNVPDWLIHFDTTWTTDDGEAHQRSDDEYFLLLVNWLRTNHPAAAKGWMQRVAFQIAKVKYGIRSADRIG